MEISEGALSRGQGHQTARRAMLGALISASAFLGLPDAGRADEISARGTTMTIKLTTVEGRSLSATLIDSPAARDFASLLPLNLIIEDYASTEKISDLPKRLSTEGSPDGFAPWGNLAIFYRHFRYSPGLIRIGRLEGHVAALSQSGPISVMIESQRAPVGAK